MSGARRPVRVLHLSTRLEGGVEVIARMIEAALAEHGVAATHRVLIPKGASRSETVMAVLRAALSLLLGRYDAVFAYQSAAAVLMGLVGSLARVPIRAAHLTALPEGLMGRWVRLDAWAGRFGLYTHIVANCEATAAAYDTYPQAYRDRIVTIPHGVSPLPALGRPVNWRARLGVPKRVPLLVATGRLADQKDYATAVRALPRVPDAVLAIAGEGPRRDDLVALAEAEGVADRLHLLGALPREALHELVVSADAYVFPSVWESFGLAGAEALMAGTPVVASDLAVLREVLGVPGLPLGMVRFHTVGDARGLARELRGVLSSPLPTSSRRRAGRVAAAHHAPSLMARRYVDLLAQGAARRRTEGPTRRGRFAAHASGAVRGR